MCILLYSSGFLYKTDVKSWGDYVSEKIVVDMPLDWDQKRRSREIKTTLRKIIKGNYLFVDTDTVICSSLEDVDDFDCPISAVFDCHHPYSPSIHFISGQLGKLGASANVGDCYFNSGVMFVKDDENTHKFYEIRHGLYRESVNKGFSADQASLFVANQQYPLIKEMGGEFNCQIFCGGLPWLSDSKIVHAFNNVQSWGHGNPSKNQEYDPSKPYSFYRPADTNFLLKIKQQGRLLEEDKQVILTAKRQFYGEYKLMFGHDLDFYHSAFYHLFMKMPRMFKVFEMIAKIALRFGK